MEVKQSITINAPADDVWEVLAHRFGDVGAWASGVYASAPRPAPGPSAAGDAPVEGRVCETSVGSLKETFVRYDEGGKSFAYRAEGLPSVVTEGVNSWSVRPRGPDRSVVDMWAEMKLKPGIGLVAGPVMKLWMGRLLRETAEDLKHYAETGEPHPRKLRARARQAKRAKAAPAR